MINLIRKFEEQNGFTPEDAELLKQIEFISKLIDNTKAEFEFGYDTMGVVMVKFYNDFQDIGLHIFPGNYIQLMFLDLKQNLSGVYIEILKNCCKPEVVSDLNAAISLNTNKIDLENEAFDAISLIIKTHLAQTPNN